MKLTLVLPALNYADSAALPPLHTPALDELLRFGSFSRRACAPSELYARYLWRGSLLAQAKAAVGVAAAQPAVLAAPVWQQMGMHHMNMLSGADIQIASAEAERLCRELSGFYHDDGFRFAAVRPDLWLLEMPQTPDWQAVPLWDVLGRVDGTVRAEGAGSAQWLQLQTEMQMWLHSHALNAERLAAGLPAINGLWLWHDTQGSAQTGILGSNSPWAQFYAGTRLDAPYDFPAWLAMLEEAGQARADSVLFLDDLAVAAHTGNGHAYHQTVTEWEQCWFAPVWEALQTGYLHTLIIHTESGKLAVSAKPQWRFWKKRRTFGGVF